MPREPKPYWKKQQQRWVCTIDGQRLTLGTEKKAAFDKFHKLMLDRKSVKAELSTVYQLSQAYLDWCKENRSEGTYKNHLRYLKGFIDSIGKTMKVAALRKHHVLNWSKEVGTTTSQNDAISIVQRMFNWAIEHEYLHSSPIPKVTKPKRKRREIVYTPEQWETIKSHASPELTRLIDFLWATGCRPKEARTVEARHVHGDLVIFPPDESKGEADSRVIFLTPEAASLIKPLLGNGGALFKNTRGLPWTKDALVQAMQRISEKVGFRVIAYGARHSYATNALIRSVDTVSLSHLMGHKSTRMVSNYAHLSQNMEHLRNQARNASGSTK
ncbi:tyrosine-type recombinase/integrase [Planctomycetaceae bacterium SH139]